jgi:hypothetical protein
MFNRRHACSWDGIAPSDVRQGGVGDCTLQASLASLARTPAGRTYLQNNVRENRDEHGAITSYTVTLFKKSSSGAYERTQIDVPNVCLASRGFALMAIEARPVRQADGSYQVEGLYVLRNPWGYDNPRPMTIDEVKKYFSTYSEGDVP